MALRVVLTVLHAARPELLDGLIGGTMFLLWLGEQITSRGIGNGTSLIIMAGIVAQMPSFIANLMTGYSAGSIPGYEIAGLVLLLVMLILGICFMERATRRQRWVLQRMVKTGLVTEAQAQQAAEDPVVQIQMRELALKAL